MSLNPVELKLFRTIDPVCRISNEREYTVFKGGREVFYYPFPTSGSANASVNTFNCNPTNQKTIVDRKIFLLADFTLSFSGVINNTGGATASIALLQAGFDAPRAYPLSMCTKNLTITLGDNAIATNLNEYFSAIERYANARDGLQDRDYSMTPSMPDQYQNYSAGTNKNNSELGFYGTNSAQVPRGFDGSNQNNSWYTVTQSTVAVGAGATAGGTASVRLVVCEPVFLSPLYFGHSEQSGFIGIQNMTISQQFGDLTRLWSHATNSINTISFPSGLSVTVNSMKALVKQVTPELNAKIPEVIPYPLSQITPYISGSVVNLTAGATGQASSGSITLNSVPTRIYVYARQQNSELTATSCDTFASLGQITVQLGTRQLLSSATQQDLYQISVRNGCNMNFEQWVNKVGSVLALDLSKDLGLSELEAPSLLSKSTLQVTCSIGNPNANTINYVLYVLVCEEGTFTISNSHAIKSIGVLSSEDILRSADAPDIPYKVERNIYGSAWYDDLWSGIKDVGKFVINNADKIIPIAEKVLPMVGMGEDEGNARNLAIVNKDAYMAEGRRHHKGRGLSGGALVGGRRMHRHEM